MQSSQSQYTGPSSTSPKNHVKNPHTANHMSVLLRMYGQDFDGGVRARSPHLAFELGTIRASVCETRPFLCEWIQFPWLMTDRTTFRVLHNSSVKNRVSRSRSPRRDPCSLPDRPRVSAVGCYPYDRTREGRSRECAVFAASHKSISKSTWAERAHPRRTTCRRSRMPQQFQSPRPRAYAGIRRCGCRSS